MKIILFLSFFFSIFISIPAFSAEMPAPVCVCDRMTDSLALVDLYNSTNGANWTNPWTLTDNMDTWQGVAFEGGDCVARLNLRNNNLVGTIPSSVGNLEDLNNLDLSFNDLSGVIPTSMGNLLKLTNLNLTKNSFGGSIPTSLGNLTLLSALQLHDNLLTGTIPSELGSLPRLKVLELYKNQLTGSIPSELGNLPQLERLWLWANDLSGTIPEELGNISTLENISIFDNQLTGAIPSSFGNLSNLTFINIADNMLDGTIPASLGNLANLEVLKAQENQLSGSIPAELSDLIQLSALELNENNLSGSIPPQLGNLAKLIILKLQDNNLTGDIPLDLINFNETATILYLHNNDLSGCFSAEFAAFCDNPNIDINFSGNAGLAEEDFSNFCLDGSGGCITNDDCETAITLPINLDPCGRESRAVLLRNATTYETGPFGVCDSSFMEGDVWFKVVVPPTRNFLIKKDSLTNIRLFAEAYVGEQCPPTASDVIACQLLNQYPHVMIIEDRTPGEVIYFRMWDSLNLAFNQQELLQTEISAHELPAQESDWVLCDFSASADGTVQGTGVRKANEFMVQYDDDDDADSIALKRNILRTEFGAELIDSCHCNVSLEVWKSDNIIDLEATKEGAKSKGEVDTTGYNYIISTLPLFDTLAEGRAPLLSFGDQKDAQIAMDADGNYVVVWEGYGRDFDTANEANIYIRLFNSDGEPEGRDFRINEQKTGHQHQPAISMQANGDFVLSWIGQKEANGTSEAIWVKRFDKTGNVLLSDRVVAEDGVDAFGTFTVGHPHVAINDDGSYVVAYHQSHSSTAVYKKVGLKLYDNDDILVSTPNFINPTKSYYFPQVAIANNGQFIVTANVFPTEHLPSGGSDDYDIIAQLYDENGAPIGDVNPVNTTQIGAQISPKVAMDGDGNSIIVWTDSSTSDNGNVIARRYDNTGNPLSGEITVNTNMLGTQTLTGLAMDDSGDYLIAWESEGQDGDEFGAYSQYFNQNGDAIGNEFRINTTATHSQRGAAVAMNERGNVVYTWHERYLKFNVYNKHYFSPHRQQVPLHIVPAIDTLLGVKSLYDPTIYSPNTNPVGSVTVASLDSGIDAHHPNLASALWQATANENCLEIPADSIGYDFIHNHFSPLDSIGHGTGGAGILVENFPSDIDLNLMTFKFYNENGSTLFDAVCGIYSAIELGADVINLSWGFESQEFPRILEKALIAAREQDILIVTSAGNSAKNNDMVKKYPANISKDSTFMITVASYDELAETGAKELSPFSSFGAQNVDIAASGNRQTLALGGGLTCLSGTSLAAPAVAQVAAIIKGYAPELTAPEIIACILDNVEPVSSLDGRVRSGGVLNKEAALVCAGVLPLTWLDFQAQANKEETVVQLTWQVGIEENNAYFEIQHSKNVNDFDKIGRVESKGNNSHQSAYEYTHHSPVQGTNYYRIQQVDIDGKVTYSAVRQVEFKTPTSPSPFFVYPNPVQNNLFIKSKLDNTAVMKLNLIAPTGQRMKTWDGAVGQALEVGDLLPGVYYLQIFSGTETATISFVKL